MKREREEDEVQSEQKRRNERRGGSGEPSQQPAGAAAGAAVSADERHTFTTGELELEPPISLLPRDLLPHVFSLLDLSNRCRARRVCRAWRAAALEPPHSTTLTLALPCRSRGVTSDGPADLDGADEAPATEDPAALQLAEKRFFESLSNALASSLAAGLKTASFSLDDQPGSRGSSQPRRWPLADALWALRVTSVASLSLHLQLAVQNPNFLSAVEKDWLRADLRIIRNDTLPALRELQVSEWLTRLLLFNREGKPVPRVVHSQLQRMYTYGGYGEALQPQNFIKQLPSLTRLESLSLDPSVAPRDLRQLANRGLKVRSLRLQRFNMAPPGGSVVASIFRPAEFGWSLPGPSELQADATSLSSGLPAGFGAGVQQVRLGAVHPLLLPWLAEIASNSALRKLVFARSTAITNVSAVQLLQTLQGCCDGLDVLVRWPFNTAGWGVPALDAAVRFLLSNRRVLLAVRLGLGDFLAAVECSEFGGGVVKQEGSGTVATGPLTTAATLLAAEYHVARCEEITKRRSLLVHELWELSNARNRLARLTDEDAAALLGRCRALGDGRWPEWPPETPLPAITRLESLRLDASSRWDVAALPVLAAKGFRTHHLVLLGFRLTDPVVASAAKAIFDPTGVPDPSLATLELQSCLLPPAVDGLGVEAQKIVLWPTTKPALPWIAKVSRSPALLQLHLKLDPEFQSHAFEVTSLRAVLEALRGCREGLEIVIGQSTGCLIVRSREFESGVALILADPKLLAAVRLDLGVVIFANLLARPRHEAERVLMAEWIAARCEAAGGRRALLDWEVQTLKNKVTDLSAACLRQGAAAGRPQPPPTPPRPTAPRSEFTANYTLPPVASCPTCTLQFPPSDFYTQCPSCGVLMFTGVWKRAGPPGPASASSSSAGHGAGQRLDSSASPLLERASRALERCRALLRAHAAASVSTAADPAS